MSKKHLDIDKLPYKESMTKGKDMWRYRKDDCHKVNGKYPWTHVQRVLKKYKGKNVDKAFTHYCSIVPKHQQRWFLEELEEATRHGYRFRGSYWGYWYVDKNKCIQYHEGDKREISYEVYSHDIEWGYVNIKYTDENVRWWKNGYRYNGTEYVVTKGEIFTFKKIDASYHRCKAEQDSKRRKAKREAEVEARKIQLSFLTREEIEDKEDKKNDIIKRDSHGFDENSFTNNNGRLN